MDHVTPDLYPASCLPKNWFQSTAAWFIKHWMVLGQSTFLICCHIMNRPLRSAWTGPSIAQTKHAEAAFSFYTSTSGTNSERATGLPVVINPVWGLFCLSLLFKFYFLPLYFIDLILFSTLFNFSVLFALPLCLDAFCIFCGTLSIALKCIKPPSSRFSPNAHWSMALITRSFKTIQLHRSSMFSQVPFKKLQLQ